MTNLKSFINVTNNCYATFAEWSNAKSDSSIARIQVRAIDRIDDLELINCLKHTSDTWAPRLIRHERIQNPSRADNHF